MKVYLVLTELIRSVQKDTVQLISFFIRVVTHI